MQLPIRKPGQYTNIKADPFMTEEKHKELTLKLSKLKSSQPQVIAEVKRLASDGDFSENVAYQIAKGRLRSLNENIKKIEDHLKFAQIIKPAGPANKVQLGSRVTVSSTSGEKTYKILGSSETNPAKGIISHNSPLGSALIGRKAGDIVKTKINNREVDYKIIKAA